MSILALTSNTLAGTAGAGQVEYNGQFYATDSNASRGQIERLVQGTAVASTSGTSIDFTSIPAWAKRITVMFSGVSTNGTSPILIQLGAGSITTTGYVSTAVNAVSAGTGSSYSTAGLIVESGTNTTAASIRYLTETLLNISANSWMGTGLGAVANTQVSFTSGGAVTLSSTLDRVRITTVNGTDTFDAGSINIMYEG